MSIYYDVSSFTTQEWANRHFWPRLYTIQYWTGSTPLQAKCFSSLSNGYSIQLAHCHLQIMSVTTEEGDSNHLRYDTTFLVKRTTATLPSLILALSQRIIIIYRDMTLNIARPFNEQSASVPVFAY